jgi:hypothetical protein
MGVSAREIFFNVLVGCKENTFTADIVRLHQAFYDLFRENREVMEDFDFIIRINPYSPTLEELIQYYQLCGILSRKNPDFIRYEIDRDRLEKVEEASLDGVKLNKPPSFSDIFGE